MTSVFGMNTSDIRDMERTQSFFWAISIPVTAAIVTSAVLLAYRGDKLYDAVQYAFDTTKEKYARKKARNVPLKVDVSWWDRMPLVFRRRTFRERTPAIS